MPALMMKPARSVQRDALELASLAAGQPEVSAPPRLRAGAHLQPGVGELEPGVLVTRIVCVLGIAGSPRQLAPKQARKLKGLKAADFDKQYESDQQSAHEDAVSLFERLLKGRR